MNDCWYEYHRTLAGVAITVNIALNFAGPIPCPLTEGLNLTKGTIVHWEIENPTTWPSQFQQFWFNDEIWAQWNTTPVTRCRITIAPDAHGDVEFNVAAPYCCPEYFHTPCPADFNMNGFVDGDDVDKFLDRFYWGCEQADFDGNTFVNGDDFDLFVAQFFAGC